MWENFRGSMDNVARWKRHFTDNADLMAMVDFDSSVTVDDLASFGSGRAIAWGSEAEALE